jgi:UDP-glucose:glycoprotein glucosyltransferase
VTKGINVFWVNGLQIDVKDVNPLGLLRLLRKEKETLNSLASRRMTRRQATERLLHPEIATRQGQGSLDATFGASDRSEGGGLIIWWNDIEKDSRYVFMLEITG